ncbi:MAG: hypothetical protein KDK55_06670 [Chlamydiia bacterium]|nr:hypothetical protein [Chlamydiia bacterium]
MKRVLLTAVASLVCMSGVALPLGNPAEASIYTNGIYCGYNNLSGGFCNSFSFRLGFYGDYVFNRHLRLKENGLDASGNGRGIQETQLNTNAGYIVFNYCDLIDIFATLGVSNLSIMTSEISWIFNGNRLGEFFTDTTISWSFGGRISLYEWRCWTLGIEGQYFQFDPHVTQFADGARNIQFSSHNRWKYREWQVGAGIAYTIYVCDPKFTIVPYAGVKWSSLCLKTGHFWFISNTETFEVSDMNGAKDWGWALGATCAMCDVVGVTVEGRWADEKALHVRGQFRF